MTLKLIVTASAAVLAVAAATAQTRLTLEECVAMAKRNNYAMRAAQGEVEKARALQGTAWAIDNTSLSLGQDPTSGGSPDNSLTLSQSFDFPTVYTARRRTLKAETDVAEKRLNVSGKKLVAEISELYMQMVYTLEKKRILLAQDTLLARYSAIADIRYKAGEARQLEQLTASRMLSENRMEIEAADAGFRTMQQRMGFLLNTGTGILPSDSVLSPIELESVPVLDYSATAEGSLASSVAEKARREVSEAKSGWLPTFNVALRSQLVLKGWNPYDVDRSRFAKGNFMGFEVGIGLPVFFGARRAKVKAAVKEREITELYARQQMKSQESEYSIQRNSLENARRRMDYYRSEGLHKASEMARIAQISYENGDIGYVEYVQAMLDAASTQLKNAEAILEYNRAALSLQSITR